VRPGAPITRAPLGLDESAVTLAVPLTVDVGIATNWRDAKP